MKFLVVTETVLDLQPGVWDQSHYLEGEGSDFFDRCETDEDRYIKMLKCDLDAEGIFELPIESETIKSVTVIR